MRLCCLTPPHPNGRSTKPWVTIFDKDAFRDENFIYLPFLIQDGADMDSVMLDEVRPYFS